MKIFLIAIVILFFFSFEFASLMTFGWMIPKKKLTAFFEKNLDAYAKADKTRGMFYGPPGLPYIAKTPAIDYFAKWYIGMVGRPQRIPRWSKWSKKLDEIQQKKPNLDKYI